MGIARLAMAEFPDAWAFFVPFILIATLTMLNLFIAVIVNAVQSKHDEEHQQARDTNQATRQELLEVMRKLQREVSALRGYQCLKSISRATRSTSRRLPATIQHTFKPC